MEVRNCQMCKGGRNVCTEGEKERKDRGKGRKKKKAKMWKENLILK